MKNHPLLLFPDFRKFFAGRFASAIGDKFFSIALAWWVVNRGGPNASLHLGFLMTMTMLPIVIFGPVMGTLADRFHRKKCMISSDAARLSLLLILSALLATERLTLPVLYLLVFAISTFMPLFEASANSSLEALTDSDHVTAAAAVNSTAFQFSSVIGAALGGAALAAVGTMGAFLFDAGTFSISLLLILAIKADLAPPDNGDGKPRYGRQMAEGFAYIRNNKPVALLLAVFGAFNFFFSPVLLAIPLTVKFIIQEGPLWVGLFEGALASGALLSALFLSMRPFLRPYRRIAGGLFLTAAAIVLFGIVDYKATMLISLFAAGLGLGTVNATTPALFQKVVPNAFRGRFFALMTTVCYAVMPLAFILFGFLNHIIALPLLLATNGAGALLLAVAFLVIPRARIESSH